jgi:hypothetical protein
MKLPLEQFSCQATAYDRENGDVRYRCSLFSAQMLINTTKIY